jgi:hypothetical protein
MTRPSDTHRPGEHPLSLIHDNPRRAPGTSLEPRRRGDVELPSAPCRPTLPRARLTSWAHNCVSAQRLCSG